MSRYLLFSNVILDNILGITHVMMTLYYDLDTEFENVSYLYMAIRYQKCLSISFKISTNRLFFIWLKNSGSFD